MSVLAIDVGTTGVTAVVVDDAGTDNLTDNLTDSRTVVATGHHEVTTHHPAPGRVEQAPDEIWRATLDAVRDAVAQVDVSTLQGVGVTARHGTVVLWDRETLGSPRPVVTGTDRRTDGLCARLGDHADRVAALSGLPLDPRFSGPTLLWLAEHEPRTWDLVAAGRYAVGTVESYLVARMTRGLEHVTDVAGASSTQLLDLAVGGWSDELCGLFGVLSDALPELVPTWGPLAVTDPRTFAGLALPLTGMVGEPAALLLAGATSLDHEDERWALALTGATPAPADAGCWSTAAWRTPAGETTYAVARPLAVDPPATRPAAAALGAAVAASRGLAGRD